MRLLVCGGRHYADIDHVYDSLDLAHAKTPITLLIEGGATGADSLARTWARSARVESESYVANWRDRGKRAGPERNQRMIDEGKPDGAIAFPGGRGTADMVKRLEAAGVAVWKPYG